MICSSHKAQRGEHGRIQASCFLGCVPPPQRPSPYSLKRQPSLQTSATQGPVQGSCEQASESQGMFQASVWAQLPCGSTLRL